MLFLFIAVAVAVAIVFLIRGHSGSGATVGQTKVEQSTPIVPRQVEQPTAIGPRQAAEPQPRPSPPEPTYITDLNIPRSRIVAANTDWENRFEIPSTTSNRHYVVGQHRQFRYWSCSCPGWKRNGHCKHLDKLALPQDGAPHEVTFEVVDTPATQAAPKGFPPDLTDELGVDLLLMTPPRYVIFDLETTGRDPNAHDIIEIGAIKVTHGSTSMTLFQTYVKPDQPVPPVIARMTGITQAMVEREGKPLESALKDFQGFVGGLPLLSYGADFDMRFLRYGAKRVNMSFDNRCLCVLKLARKAWPQLPSHKLEDMATILKFSTAVTSSNGDEGTHRALGDCKRTYYVYHCVALQLGFPNCLIHE